MSTPVWNKPRRMPLIPRIVSAVVVAGVLGALGFWAVDLARVERENAILPPPKPAQKAEAEAMAQAEWRIVRGRLEARLKQTRPLDLGAIWATRTGQVCGLVNGRGSFGGLTGMARFYTVDRRPVFHQDVEHLDFQQGWFECRRDRWVGLHDGAEEPGFCGTELGKRRCYTVRIRDRVRTVEPAPGGPPAPQ